MLRVVSLCPAVGADQSDATRAVPTTAGPDGVVPSTAHVPGSQPGPAPSSTISTVNGTPSVTGATNLTSSTPPSSQRGTRSQRCLSITASRYTPCTRVAP